MLTDDVDPEIFIDYLAGPLPPDVRPAFRRAAEAALAAIRCPGPGVIHRVLAPLQRTHLEERPPLVTNPQHHGRRNLRPAQR